MSIIPKYSLSCTDHEWEQIRERAAGKGKSMSRYLVDRSLSVDLPEPEVRTHRLVLDTSEQQEMHGCITRLADQVGQLPNGDMMTTLLRSVTFLADITMHDMIRNGRSEELEALLTGLFGSLAASNFLKRSRERMAKVDYRMARSNEEYHAAMTDSELPW